jgi:hypothetical protein
MVQTRQTARTKSVRVEADAVLGSARPWGQVSKFLDSIERSERWQSEAGSFTEWLHSVAQKASVNQSVLWRYLTAGRYYEQIRKTLPSRLAPPLDKLPNEVSSESLELLSKLARVVPADTLRSLTERVLSGEMSRNHLRETWKTFRPVLKGRNARGRGTAAPKINLKDEQQRGEQTEALIRTTLVNGSPKWTGVESPAVYRVFSEPRHIPTGIRFDLMAVVQETANSPLLMLGVEVKFIHHRSDIASLRAEFERLVPYCDRLWLAANDIDIKTLSIPAFVGVLCLRDGVLEAARRAKPSANLGARTGEMAKNILARII